VGTTGLNALMEKFTISRGTITTQPADDVARLQFKPIATAGTIAEAPTFRKAAAVAMLTANQPARTG